VAHAFAVHGPGAADFYMQPFLNGREKIKRRFAETAV
jgi:hypothetical protein